MTSAPVVDLRPHYAALRPAIDAQIAPWKSYRDGEVPGVDGNDGTEPPMCALLALQRLPFVPTVMSGMAGTSGWMLVVRGVGTTHDEAAHMLNRVAQALEERRFTVNGWETSPLYPDASTGDPIARDGDRYSGAAAWTYVL